MRRFSVILTGATLLAGNVMAQEVKVKAEFDNARIFIGDQIKFSVTVEKPGNLNLAIPLFTDTLAGKIEILKGPVIDSSVTENGNVRIIHKYLVTSFDSGIYQIPPVYAELKTESEIRRYYSDYSWLEVMRVNITPPDTAAGIFDIIDPSKVPLTAGEVVPWVVLMAGAAIAAWLLARFLKRLKKGKPVSVRPEITEPAHVIAFRELEKLKNEKLWQKGEEKEYYSRLTEIIRQYIMNRYAIPALEMTTMEILETIIRHGTGENETYKKLRTVLTGGDLVKFAKYQPEPSENELHFEYSWDYVKATMKTPAELETDDKKCETV